MAQRNLLQNSMLLENAKKMINYKATVSILYNSCNPLHSTTVSFFYEWQGI